MQLFKLERYNKMKTAASNLQNMVEVLALLDLVSDQERVFPIRRKAREVAAYLQQLAEAENKASSNSGETGSD